MIDKSFTTLSRLECREAYAKMLENSDMKWNSQQLIAETKDYGTTISLAVISTEELIKAFLIYLDALGFSFRKVKGISTIFKNHKLRYFIAYFIFLFIDTLEKIKSSPEIKTDSPNALEENLNKFSNDPEKYFNIFLKRRVFRAYIRFKRDFHWFSQVDQYRQDGLYSDYNAHLKTPTSITLQQYSEIIDKLDKVRQFGKSFFEIEQYEQESLDRIKQVQKDFTVKKYYEKMSSTLTEINKLKADYFEYFTLSTGIFQNKPKKGK